MHAYYPRPAIAVNENDTYTYEMPPEIESHGFPGHLIRRLHQVSTQTFQRRVEAAGSDLTPVQFAAMDAVLACPGLDQAAVGEVIGCDRATIGGVVDRLAQKGLVTRAVSPRDRRAREVRATPAGAAAMDALRPVVRALQDEILAALAPEERAAFVALAAKAVGPDPSPPPSIPDPAPATG